MVPRLSLPTTHSDPFLPRCRKLTYSGLLCLHACQTYAFPLVSPRSRRWLLGKAMPLTCRCAESTPPPPKNARASSGERRNLVIGTPYSAHQVAFSGKARIGAGPEGRDPRDGKRETHGRGRGRLPPPETVDRAGTTQIVCSRPPKDERSGWGAHCTARSPRERPPSWEPTSRCRGRRAAGTTPPWSRPGAGWEASRRYERPDA
jgi:hypothetical protein